MKRVLELTNELDDLESEERATENICLYTNSAIGLAHYNRELVKIRTRIEKVKGKLDGELNR